MSNNSLLHSKDKKEKKRARKALLILLSKVKVSCGTFRDAQEWYGFIKQHVDPVVKEFDQTLPGGFKDNYQKVKSLIDPSKEGIIEACKLLQSDLAKVIKTLPSGSVMSGLIKGVFIVGVVAAGVTIAYLNYNLVKINIFNKGCQPINPSVYSYIKIPGLVLPSIPIENGGSGVIKLPPVKFAVNALGSNINLSAFNLNLNFSLRGDIDLVFNGKSLLSKSTEVDLGRSKEHQLEVICR